MNIGIPPYLIHAAFKVLEVLNVSKRGRPIASTYAIDLILCLLENFGVLCQSEYKREQGRCCGVRTSFHLCR